MLGFLTPKVANILSQDIAKQNKERKIQNSALHSTVADMMDVRDGVVLIILVLFPEGFSTYRCPTLCPNPGITGEL